MQKRLSVGFLLVVCALFWSGGVSCPVQGADRNDPATGVLEMDCNFTGIPLRLCPKDDYVQRESKAFFGLIKSVTYVCSSEGISIGETPLKPTDVPTGNYILMVPSNYTWEEEGPIELSIRPGEKTYFLLKLFRSRANSPESNHAGGGGGAAGAGRGP